jgi:CubicO group peptidase (beta-lactamase class C family)
VLSRDLERELWAGQLSTAPGAGWEYSDPAFAHLSLAFRGITGEELHEFMERRIFQPIGLENLGWETLGVDDDRLGTHTNPFSTIHISARELARFGYLLGRGGDWENRPLVAPWWIALSTQTSQPYEQRYGLTWWVNTQGTLWPAAPRDAFSALGFNTNLCCVIPSLDLVIVRLGLGPTDSAEDITSPFIAAIVNAIVPD